MRHLLAITARGLVRRSQIGTVVTAITVATCAGFAARAAAALIDVDLGPSELPSPPPSPAPRARPPRRLATTAAADELVIRDMFCSSCGLRDPSSATGETGLTLQSLAVLIETSVGDERRATIRVLATEVQGSWGLGEAIPGLGQLDRIAPTWIELVDLAGRRGRLSLRLDSSGAAGDGPGTAMPASQPAANPWAARIHAIDGQHYEVDRDLIRELVTGVAKADGVRPVPILDHGEIKGLRLLGVSPSSIPAALGLRSGDTLTAIDGAPIKNLQQLIDLYAGLAQVSSVELSGTHGSAPLVRTLHLR